MRDFEVPLPQWHFRSRLTVGGCILSALLPLLLRPALAAQSSERSLYPDPTVRCGGAGIGAPVLDWNEDGHLDLIGDFDLCFGDGTGRFRPAFSVPDVASLWGEIAVGDFNSDGVPDVIGQGRYNGGGPRIALGEGLGAFGAVEEADSHSRDGCDSGGYSIVAADFDGDGHDDLATTNYTRGTFCVQLGNGDGTFAEPQRFGNLQYPTSMNVGDFDRDGVLDIVVLDAYSWHPEHENDAVVFLGLGNGTFQEETGLAYPHCDTAWGSEVVDFDGDLNLDLVVACIDSYRIFVQLGNGDATFQAPTELEWIWGGVSPLATGDVNLDGALDLVAGGWLYYGRGDGTFEPPMSLGPGSEEPIAIQDVDEDGRPDIVVTNGVLLSDGSGSFIPPSARRARLPVGDRPNGVVATDMNRDGHADLVTTNSDSSDLSVLLGLGDGTFLGKESFPAGHAPHDPAIGDFDGDGIPDLMVNHDGNEPHLSAYFGTSRGGFLAEYPLDYDARSFVIEDFDRDGRSDLALEEYGATPPATVLLRGRVDGTLEEYDRRVLGDTLLTSSDMNGDGIADLIFAAVEEAPATGEWILVHPGDGSGGFLPPVVSEAPRGTISRNEVSLSGDFDGDGKNDLFVTATGRLCLGDGHGTVVGCEWKPFFGGAHDAADLDGNGTLDLASAGWVGLNDGADVHLVRLSFDTSRYGTGEDAAVADLNHDGRPDLAVAPGQGSELDVFLNTGHVPDLPPIAVMQVPGRIRCTSGRGLVLLDGSRSTDLNSTPGTSDNILTYEWSERDTVLGHGVRLQAELELGWHYLTLTVTDRTGFHDSSSTSVQVLDDEPPSLVVGVSPDTLWPPNGQLVEIVTTIGSSDECGSVEVILDSVVSNEPHEGGEAHEGPADWDIQGADVGTHDTMFQLRAEREGSGTGRVYTITYAATDEHGNSTTASTTVTVPHDRRGD